MLFPRLGLATLTAAITKAGEVRFQGIGGLKSMAASGDKDAAAAKSPADAERLRGLSTIMKQGGTAGVVGSTTG